ncbi:hypothetical protein DFH07DRAFT_73688 [Mycena maculata]|uniref:Uncharacterized protein n=1 Tax=Mycena maculata TaxID=230809 RepID=A0AAD7NV25_9AGAR|nr:hypothetical protein DFH07DRAFT_73688 [Mycena maculata]
MVAPICFIQTILMIMDYKGHVLDLANSVNPVIGQTPNPTVTNNQLWDPIPINADQTNFIFETPVTNNPNNFLSYPGASTNGTLLFMQATGETFSTTFELDCVNSTSGHLLEVNSGLALTAWPEEEGSTITPVTYETFTAREEQVWTFLPA